MFYYKLKYRNKKIVLNNFKTSKEINLEINKENIDFVNELQKQIRKRLYLKDLKIYLNLGVKDNPFASALLSGGCETFLSIISSLIKFQKPTAKIYYNVTTYYTKDMGIVNIDFDIALSITNLLLSLMVTKKIINKKEQLKNDRRKAKASNRRCNNRYIKEY
ncbi:MAG: hypothetical protein IJZ29_01000 [Clostridia bacterium]|nr:hypothetical protein [Clostridia bacterium]